MDKLEVNEANRTRDAEVEVSPMGKDGHLSGIRGTTSEELEDLLLWQIP